MKKRRKFRSGQSLTEFAVGVTFILILIAGGMDLGRAYFTYISLRDAAQEGSTYASINPADVHGVRARVRDSSSMPFDLSTLGDDMIDVDVLGYACAGYDVKVTVSYDFQLAAPFIAGHMLHLNADATDTILQPPC